MAPLRIQTICPYILHGIPNFMVLDVSSISFDLNPYGEKKGMLGVGAASIESVDYRWNTSDPPIFESLT